MPSCYAHCRMGREGRGNLMILPLFTLVHLNPSFFTSTLSYLTIPTLSSFTLTPQATAKHPERPASGRPLLARGAKPALMKF